MSFGGQCFLGRDAVRKHVMNRRKFAPLWLLSFMGRRLLIEFSSHTHAVRIWLLFRMRDCVNEGVLRMKTRSPSERKRDDILTALPSSRFQRQF